MWAMLKGVPGSRRAWGRGDVKFIVTVPGYDRHFLMLERLGITNASGRLTADGPDIAAIERLAGSDPSVKACSSCPPTATRRATRPRRRSPIAWRDEDGGAGLHHLRRRRLRDSPPR